LQALTQATLDKPVSACFTGEMVMKPESNRQTTAEALVICQGELTWNIQEFPTSPPPAYLRLTQLNEIQAAVKYVEVSGFVVDWTANDDSEKHVTEFVLSDHDGQNITVSMDAEMSMCIVKKCTFCWKFQGQIE